MREPAQVGISHVRERDAPLVKVCRPMAKAWYLQPQPT
jgi:hypothetical protein